MKKQHRLAFIGKITKNREQMAAKLFAVARQKCEAESARLDELQDFHKEYYADLDNMLTTNQNPATMENYQRFLRHLESVIGSQQTNISKLQQDYQKKIELWQLCYRQNQNFQNFLAEKALEASKLEDMQTQKIEDIATMDFINFQRKTDT